MPQKRCILVAEEDHVIRTFLGDNLTADGYEVLIAEDRAGALRVLETDHPDLVFCDVNGETLSLLDAVRGGDGVASRIDRDTPLIVVTGASDELSRLRFFDRGCDDVLAKPFSYHELRARVRAMVRRASSAGRRPVLRVGELRSTRSARCTSPARAVSSPARVRAAAPAGARPDPGVHQARTAAGRVGVPLCGSTRTLDSHACRLRQKLRGPATARRERVGRRLPADRRPAARRPRRAAR